MIKMKKDSDLLQIFTIWNFGYIIGCAAENDSITKQTIRDVFDAPAQIKRSLEELTKYGLLEASIDNVTNCDHVTYTITKKGMRFYEKMIELQEIVEEKNEED